MNINRTIEQIESCGVSLYITNGNIYAKNASRLTEDLRQKIKQNKTEIVRHLAGSFHLEVQKEAIEAAEERAAILEYEGGLSREDAEREAVCSIRVYNYIIKEKPESLLTAIMPNTSLEEARKILIDRYSDRLLMVLEHKVNLKLFDRD